MCFVTQLSVSRRLDFFLTYQASCLPWTFSTTKSRPGAYCHGSSSRSSVIISVSRQVRTTPASLCRRRHRRRRIQALSYRLASMATSICADGLIHEVAASPIPAGGVNSAGEEASRRLVPPTSAQVLSCSQSLTIPPTGSGFWWRECSELSSRTRSALHETLGR